jgi:ribosomal protein S21
MPLEVRKQEKENTQSLIRRFTRGLQQSGILTRAKMTRFRLRPKSHGAKKKAALRRVELKQEYEKLRKLGKVE